MTTLADITRLVAIECLQTWGGEATGGSATTLVNSALDEPDNRFNGGTVWITSGLNIGKSAVISGWVNSTHTATFPTMTLAVAATDKYTIAPNDISRAEFIDAVNAAMRRLGVMEKSDATLTPLDNTYEYSLPTGVKEPTRILIDNVEYYSWRVINGKLSFSKQVYPSVGSIVVIYYNGEPTALSLDADVIPAIIPTASLVFAAAEIALKRRMMFDTSDKMQMLYKIAQENALRTKWTPPKSIPSPKFSSAWESF